MQEKIKHLLKCLSGYVELAKLLQKPENETRSNELHKTNENAISSLPGRARHSRQDQDVLVITLVLEVIVINIIITIIRNIIIVRVFFFALSNVITKLISTINLAAKITAFTYCLPRLRSISLA